MNLRSLALPLVVVGIVSGYGYFTQAHRDAGGAIDSGGRIDAFDIRVGDCFNDSSSASTDEYEEVSSVGAVPCSEPHDNEVYAVFDLSLDEFPGRDEISNLAVEECVQRFEGFVGRDYQSSSLDVNPLYPTIEGWTAMGDREIVCSVYDMEFNKLTGSARGTGI